MYPHALAFGLGIAISLAAMTTPVSADAVADFYRGKTVNIVIPTSAGGEYDLHGRLISRFIGHHIPGNPIIVPQNMAGGGGLVATNYVYNVSPKDGSSLLIVNKSLPAAQAMGQQGLKADMAKFTYIGTLAPSSETMVVWHTTGVKSVEDARRTEVVVGTTGTENITYMLPKLMNALLGTRFKLITGYRGGNEVNAAMERGEVGGRQNAWTSWKSTKPHWLKSRNIIVIAQGGSRIRELPDVPDVERLAKSDDDRKVFQLILEGSRLGRALLAPPGVPADRLAALRKAFEATMKDPQFLAACNQAKVDPDPVTGADLQQTVEKVLAMRGAVTERTKMLLK
jgi:tripartite-type tricarboxylate transporter receptor subunit TctC